MTNDLTAAVRRLKELQEDVERLKAARDEAGETRLLRLVRDRSETSVTVNARRNDAEATDRSETNDSVTTSTGDAGSWTWRDSDYRFDEWGRNGGI